MSNPFRPFAFLVAIAACADTAPISVPLPDTGPMLVHLRTDRDRYSIGENATITMTNAESATVVTGCSEDALERQVGSTWVEVPRSTIECPEIAISIPPGQSIALPIDLRAAKEPGVYRFRRPFWLHTNEHTERSYRRSNAFIVLP